MKKNSPPSLAVLGSGWSGSGAIIDLLKKKSRVASYPYELDFWRRPNGLHDLKSRRELLFFFGSEIFASLNLIFKTFCKLMIQPSALKINLRGISIQLRMFILMTIFFSFTIFNSEVQSKKIYFLKIFKLFFGGNASVFVYDQAVFLEQINDANLGDLNVDACIIVLRDVFDQVQDLLNNSSFLKTSTIRESFFLGALGDFGINPNSLQLKLVLLTLKHRIRKIRELVTLYPNAFLILKYEDIVEDTDLVVSKLNKFLQLRGFPSTFIELNGAKEIFFSSRENIGIGKLTHWEQLSIMEEINKETNFLISKFK